MSIMDAILSVRVPEDTIFFRKSALLLPSDRFLRETVCV